VARHGLYARAGTQSLFALLSRSSTSLLTFFLPITPQTTAILARSKANLAQTNYISSSSSGNNNNNQGYISSSNQTESSNLYIIDNNEHIDTTMQYSYADDNDDDEDEKDEFDRNLSYDNYDNGEQEFNDQQNEVDRDRELSKMLNQGYTLEQVNE
jgi:hypothetical protein